MDKVKCIPSVSVSERISRDLRNSPRFDEPLRYAYDHRAYDHRDDEEGEEVEERRESRQDKKNKRVGFQESVTVVP